jgi:hypothetical protein
MKILFLSDRKAQSKQLAPAGAGHPCLARTYVETGDERCPLAGIWSRLPGSDAALNDSASDDPEIFRPAMGALLPWRAFPQTLSVR